MHLGQLSAAEHLVNWVDDREKAIEQVIVYVQLQPKVVSSLVFLLVELTGNVFEQLKLFRFEQLQVFEWKIKLNVLVVESNVLAELSSVKHEDKRYRQVHWEVF